MVLDYLDKFYNLGTDKVSQTRFRYKVRLINQIAFISIILTIAWVFVTYIFQGEVGVLINLLTLTPMLLIFLVNIKGWINLSRFLWQLCLLGVVTFYSLLEANTGSIYYYFPQLISLFALFYLDEWKKFVPLILLEIGALFWVKTTTYHIPYSPPVSSFMEAYGDITGMVTAALISVAILFYLIYENRRAEENLATESNNLNSIIASTNDGVWLIDNNYTLVLFNDTFRQWIEHAEGISPYKGMKVVENLPVLEEQINLKANIDKVLESGMTYTLENTLAGGNLKIYMELSLNPVIEKGVIEGVACFGKDITERKQMEEELKEAKTKAEESAETKARFLSNMSHELRTPLNAISGLTQLMEKEDLDAKNLENLRNIHLSADQLLALINNILDYSRIESGKRKFKENRFNPFELLTQIESTFSYKAKETGTDFNVEVDKKVPEVLIGDSMVLMQVLNNLVSNAFKFCDEGRIDVYLKKEREREGTVTLKGIIEDTGIGIPPDKQDYVFEPFKQVEEHESRKYEGSGLGLSICKKLLEGLNGFISFESEEGKGSVFYFEMPFEIAEAEQAIAQTSAAKAEKSKADIRNANVLLVEDNKMNRMVGKQMLKKLSTIPHTAGGGEEALEQIKTNDFDIILLDIHMPDMDGFEVARRTRQLTRESKTSYVPIIIMSADVFSSTKKQAREIGIEDFIEKPVNIEELETKIGENLLSK